MAIKGITIEIPHFKDVQTITLTGESLNRVKESLVNKVLDFIKTDVENKVDEYLIKNPIKVKLVDVTKGEQD